MLSYILHITLCWTLFYGFYHLWLRNETFFRVNRWYLLATALLSLVIPVVDLYWFIPVHDEPAIVQYLQPITIGVQELEAVIITPSPGQASLNWRTILLVAYSAGAILATGRFLFGLFRIRKLYEKGEKELCTGYEYISTTEPHVPFSFFSNLFWSKSFVVDEADRQNILRHEEAHIFQRHSIDVMLMELLGIVFWCSPVIYFYKKAVKTTHEYLADDYVVARANRKKYGRLLLRQSQSGMQIAISNSLFSSQLKNRIVMITKNKSSKSASLKYLAGLPLLALLFLAFSFKDGPVNLQDQQENAVIDTLPDGDVFKVVEQMPRFPGCDETLKKGEYSKCSNKKMMEYVYQNIRYPKEAIAQGIEGMSVVKFIIEKDGSISNIESVRTIGGGCDEEVVRVVSEMTAWQPGLQRGEPVRVQFNLPVKFALDEKAENTKVSSMPLFAGCEDAAEPDKCSKENLFNFIIENLKYPKVAEAAGTEGMVMASFVIGPDGQMKDIDIKKSLSPECDAEVLKILGAMPAWTPGLEKGEPVDVELKIPFMFKLSEEKISGNARQFAGVEVFEVSPNPASGKDGFQVKFKTEAGPVSLVAYNLLGKELDRIKIDNYSGGTETVRFGNLTGQQQSSETVIVSILDESGAILKSMKVVVR